AQAADKRVAYQPAPCYHGADTFTYTVSDPRGGASTATVHVTLATVNHKPEAVDDAATITDGGPITIVVTATDRGPCDGAKDVRFADPNCAPTDATEIGTAAGGMARRSGTRISYTAPSGTFTGSDSFIYVVLDNGGNVSKPATVRATVVTNKPPQVKDGTVA